jgi:hypothetical protein
MDTGALLNAFMQLPNENKKAMEEICTAAELFSEAIKNAYTQRAQQSDQTSLARSLGLLKQVQDMACVGLLVPYGKEKPTQKS